jgi:hypothetical protein
MNKLRLFTERTSTDGSYLVRWMTGTDTKGAVQVDVPIDVEDGKVASELVAARWLLEEANVCGHDKSGAGLIIYFSTGASKKLLRGESAKGSLAKYAHFLRTRFLGADIEVESRPQQWTAFDAVATRIDARTIKVERLHLRGLGDVELTAHALEQYVERFERKPTRAWRELRLLLQDPKLYEVIINRRRVTTNLAHRNAGRFFYLPNRDLIFVVTEANHFAPARIVTIYAADAETKLRLSKAKHLAVEFEDLGDNAANNLDAALRGGLVQ